MLHADSNHIRENQELLDLNWLRDAASHYREQRSSSVVDLADPC